MLTEDQDASLWFSRISHFLAIAISFVLKRFEVTHPRAQLSHLGGYEMLRIGNR